MQTLLGVAGSMAGEGSLLFWVATHRRHHKYSDTEGDPHSPYTGHHGYLANLRGLWHAHVAWMYRHRMVDAAIYAKDLLLDPTTVRLSRYYLALVLLGLAIPAVASGAITNTWEGFCHGLFWGGFFRMFLAHHFTWSINSICHTFGRRDFKTGDRSTNNLWLAIPTLGESWHNNHHDAPSAASFSRAWWQLDIGACLIGILEYAGLAWNVKHSPSRGAKVSQRSSQNGVPVPTAPKDGLPRAVNASITSCTTSNTSANLEALRTDIHDVIVRLLDADSNSPASAVQYNVPLTAQGMDSIAVTVAALELEKLTSVPITPDVIYEYATIDGLTSYLAKRIQERSPRLTASESPNRQCLAHEGPRGTTESRAEALANVLNVGLGDSDTNDSEKEADALCGSMAEFAAPSGRALLDRVAAFDAWRKARHETGVWPFYRLAQSPAAPNTSISDFAGLSRPCINFASQDYLGLARDTRVLTRAQHAIMEYGVHSAGSPALLGTTLPMAELERVLAAATRKQDCVVFPTGWAAGFGVVTGLVRPHDTLILDSLCHRCLMEGAYHVTRHPLLFRHNDLDHLCELLRHARERDANNGLFVVAESLYSMDSDCPDLRSMVRLVRDFNGILILDIAHDFGAMGNNGLGMLEQLDNTCLDVDVAMGSFSKTFAATGGFVSAAQPVVDYLRAHTTSFVYSNAISPVQAAAALECCSIVFSEEGRVLRERLMHNVLSLRSAMEEGGCQVQGSPSPIVPVIVGRERVARLIAREISRSHLLANLVEYPAVPLGRARFRFQVMSTHTAEDAGRGAELFAAACRSVASG